MKAGSSRTPSKGRVFDLVVARGGIVLDDGIWEADLGISGEKIAAIGEAGTFRGDTTIDARGMLVFPGLIDPHVHLSHRVSLAGQVVEADDGFYSGTAWAAATGTTTVIDFAPQGELAPVDAAVKRRDALAAEAAIDFGIHVVLTRSEAGTIDGIPGLVRMGVPSVKMYMIYGRQGRMADDGLLLAALQEASQAGALVAVHAENDALFEWNLSRMTETQDLAPDAFPRSKPPYLEGEAVERAIFLARVAASSLYIVHVSTAQAAELIADAQAAGQRVYAETCPQYLVLDESVYMRQDGHRFICSPPIRGTADREALWRAIARGSIDVVSSDHCGFGTASKDSHFDSFPMVPNGLPGVGIRLPLLFTYGVAAGRIEVPRLSALVSTNPARRFGLWPQKGSLMPGADADIAIVDPQLKQRVRADHLDTPVDWTPYEGLELSGWARIVISRGAVVGRDGKYVAEPGRGRFIARSRQPSAAGSFSHAR